MAAKEVAISKRVKITEAQQYMLLSVIGASIVLGVAVALTARFIKQISFNISVIAAEEEAVVKYSNVIKSVGICKSPEGEIYTDKEIKECDPDSVEITQVPDTLRANILEKLAANEALNSVPKEDNSSCIDSATGKNYTYKKLNEIYNEARGGDELAYASQLIKSCSALRIIPDALPVFRNEEALLASLNKLFLDSGWQPESISPGETSSDLELSTNLNPIGVNLLIEANTSTTMNVLNNIEHSIREFDIQKATIEWSGDNQLSLRAWATAYYTDKTSINETSKTIVGEGK